MCYFCEAYKLSENDCRKFYEDDHCYALLEAEQSVHCYSLVIPKKHQDKFTGTELTDADMLHVVRKAQEIARAIKSVTFAENIYVAVLCDGISHFHIHLIPRFKWTDKDYIRYKDLFLERDGLESVSACINNKTIGGFWYLADAERNYQKTPFMALCVVEREQILYRLSQKISRYLER